MEPTQNNSELRINVVAKVPFAVLQSTRQQDATKDIPDREPSPASIPDVKFTRPLLTAWLISLIGCLQCGLSFGVTGAVKEHAVFPGHARFEWSVFVAIFSIGGLIGSFVGGRIGSSWSRKKGVLTVAVMNIAAGIIMASSLNVYMLIVGRFLVGIAAGLSAVFVPLYIREISAPNVRGTLGTGFQLVNTLGVFTGDVLAFAFSGPYQSLLHPGWRLLLGFSVVVGVLQIVLLPLMPESPCWLIRANRTDEAVTILKHLRNRTDISIELQLIQDGLEQDKMQASMSLRGVLGDRSIRRPLVIGCILPLIPQLSGFSAVMFYANQVFKTAGLHNPQVGTMLVGTINFLSTCVALVLMDRAGRRPLLILSCIGMLVSQIVVTLALLGLTPASTVISMVAVLGCVAFYEFGLGPIQWLIVAEMLPPAPRAHAVSLATMVQWICNFVIGLIFPSMQSGLGNYSFAPFAVCLLFSLFFILQWVPETKSRSVEAIRDDMDRRKRNKGFSCPKSGSRLLTIQDGAEPSF